MIEFTDLLKKGENMAVSYEIETIDHKTNKTFKISGDITRTANQSVCSAAIKEEFNRVAERFELAKVDLSDDLYEEKITQEGYNVAV